MEEISEDHARALILSCLTNNLTEPEEQDLLQWGQSNPVHRAILDWLENEEELARNIARWRNIDPGKGYDRWIEGRKGRIVRLVMTVGIAIAAACLAIVILRPWSWQSSPTRSSGGKTPLAVHDRLPGRNKAILTLSNGHTVVLDSVPTGLIGREGNAQLIKPDSGSLSYRVYNKGMVTSLVYNILSIPRAGHYRVDLPDGSKVWLNSASQLRYPTTFSGKDRTVELTGEAYFEVAKDNLRPFMVKTGDQLVEVLGTSFNIMAYGDEHIVQTTLISGKVKLRKYNRTIILRPGEEATTANDASHFKVTIVDTSNAIAWKNGFFYFSHTTDLGSVMRQLGRWYDMEVVMQQPAKGHIYDGKISRNLSLLRILDHLQDSDVHFSIMDNKLIVTK